MFIKVRLLKGFEKTLTYAVPEELHGTSLVGKIIRVPIRNQETSAIVIKQYEHLEHTNSFTIKTAKQIEPFPDDAHYITFLETLGQYYQVDSLHFLKRIRSFLDTPLKQIETPVAIAIKKQKDVILTTEQQRVIDFLSPHLKTPTYQPTVLHGVTGSGKTEIYKALIIQAIAQQKSAILLLPEVTLAIKFEAILRAQLPTHIPIYSFHSATTVTQKKEAWRCLVSTKPALIIGVHLPILLPIANLGIIIIDEEHESGYQEKKHPKVNSKDAAILRAHQNKIPILLGSATPSLASLYNVKANGWNFFQLKQRFSGNFPQVQTVFLSDKKQRRNFWISQQLEDALCDRLEKGEQSIIFLNRRGFSFFVQCKICSFIFSCPNCSVSLTLHNNNKLTCHYCSHEQQNQQVCPACKEKKLIKKGIGTQQVVTILESLFPGIRIGRADLDTTTKKKLWQETVQKFENGSLDILVGTQTIAKGFHFPRVTLVGVLWADLNLHFPLFNATETTLQQLIQVAGRAGRGNKASEVIIQAMNEHPIFNFLHEVNYLQFYNNEIKKRKELGYPPYKRLAEIELKHVDEETIEKEAALIACAAIDYAKQHKYSMQILGPAHPPVSKIKKTHIRKIYLKGNNICHMGQLFLAIQKGRYLSSIFFTPNPQN